MKCFLQMKFKNVEAVLRRPMKTNDKTIRRGRHMCDPMNLTLLIPCT